MIKRVKTKNTAYWFLPFLFFLLNFQVYGQFEINSVGSLEGDLPAFWNKGSEPGGSMLEWAKDESFVMSRSLKISKESTEEAAMWTSDNMIDIWRPKLNANEEIALGAYVKTEGVNTSPSTDDEMWKINYTFYNSSDVLIGNQEVAIDQSVATSDWVELSGSVILPEEAYTVIVEFIGGKDATGTVWADAFKWPNSWNRTLELPTGWFNWFPWGGEGLEANVIKGFENTRVTTEEAHSGLHSVVFDLPFDREPQDAFVATHRQPFGEDIQAGDVVRISVWLKGENLVPDSAAKYPEGWSVGLTPLTFASAGNNDGYDVVWGPDLHWQFPAVESFDWTQYHEDIVVPEGAGALEVRLHVYSRFTGKIYWDDLKVEKLDIPEIATVGSLEGDLPAFWNKGSEPGGSMLEWAKDEAFVMSRSLKISKESTEEAAMWTSDNMIDIWRPKLNANEEIALGAYVKTEGVNTSPSTDDEMWKINYTFYNSSDVLIGNQEVAIDQSVATSNWVELSGSVILPEEAYTVIVEFIGGKDATGTVWADAFKWPNSWNRTLELPTGWFNWFPWGGEGLEANVIKGFENTRVTTEEAHSGLHSVVFDLPFDREPQDAFVATHRQPFGEDIQAGDVVRISVWLKGENLVPDSAAKYPEGWSVGLTPLTFASAGNNDGYDVVWGPDLHWQFPAVESFDWTQYHEDIVVPEGAGALEVRLHVYSRFTGKIYWDDLKVEKLDIPEIATVGSLEGDLPAFWNKGSEPGGSMLEWAKDEAFVMSRSLKISKESTEEAAMWTSDNMIDIWRPKLNANEEIALGAYVKTEGVNTSPSTDDEMWKINYTFYNSSDVLIGNQEVAIDQSVATSDWVELSGSVILPEEAYTVIVEFIGGKDATGTVWADAFKWPNSWNRTLELPTGWFNWFPWGGEGLEANVIKGFENTRVTTEEAHSGLHSVVFDLPFDREPQDAFVATHRQPFGEDIQAGDVVRISVWLKGENLVPDSAAKYPEGWSVGLTPLTFASAGNNDGYDVVWGPDLHWQFPAVESFDWTRYHEDIVVPEGAGALEVRLHVYSRFTGKIYWDDLVVEKIGTITDVDLVTDAVPMTYDLFQNYPNPFNPSTIIKYALPEASHVTVKVFNMLGQEVRTILDQEQSSGVKQVLWNGRNNYGSKVASGIYIYAIKANDFYKAKKMILMK